MLIVGRTMARYVSVKLAKSIGPRRDTRLSVIEARAAAESSAVKTTNYVIGHSVWNADVNVEHVNHDSRRIDGTNKRTINRNHRLE